MKRLTVFLTFALFPLSAQSEIRVRDTESGKPMGTPEALKSITMPEGFKATIYAAEPNVRQPIDMKVDARGRVWVAEAYWYPDDSGARQDRVIVLRDEDGNGAADHRTIFASELDRITSIEIGFGGVWVLAPPTLTFYPDADGDMRPDGPPVTVISNWNTHAQWNLANGLTFGPDGWLYGRQGQMGTSSPISAKGSAPGRLSGGIWRYHPPSGKLEIVAQGMTNPWGLDWNEDGELFASGNCNGHLWHIVGGSLYQWGFGAREFSSEFGRTPPIEIAPHYSPGKDWWESWKERFRMADANDAYGGGHSHSGLLICNGSAWPETMRGHTLMANIHGARINEDSIEANGSSYISRHVGDPIKARDPWFRGVSVVAAPDGAFFVSDWSDTGECHDESGVNRNSGRIYRFMATPTEEISDIDKMDDASLLVLLTGDREEPARQALRTLQHRIRQGKADSGTAAGLAELLTAEDFKQRLRALSAFEGGGILSDDTLLAASHDNDERVRAMAVRYWADGKTSDKTRARFVEMAGHEPSSRVQLHLASVTRLLPDDLRLAVTTALISRESGPIDARTARLLWHIQIQNPEFSPRDATGLLSGCRCVQFAADLARYLVEEGGNSGFNAIFEMAASIENPAPLLTAAVEAARRNNRQMQAPDGWPDLREKWLASTDDSLRGIALSASILFGDFGALDGLRDRVEAPDATMEEKSTALETIAAARTPESMSIVTRAFRDQKLRVIAIHALRNFDQPNIATSFIASWGDYNDAERHAVVATLVTRTEWARQLLAAIGAKRIDATWLSAAQARSLAESGDAVLHDAVVKNWGDPTRTDAQKQTSINRATRLLASGKPGNPEKGHALFAQTCGACHTLYGEGGKLGPDLSGRNRADLPSLLQSIVDPSAQVPEEGRLTVVTLKDGGIVSGIVISRNPSGLVIRGQQGETTVKSEEIANLTAPTTSPMPEGLLDSLTDDQLIDLLTYIRADQATPKK